jgi:hypothetical protein
MTCEDAHTLLLALNPGSSTSRRRALRTSAAVSITSMAGRSLQSSTSGAPMSSICSFSQTVGSRDPGNHGQTTGIHGLEPGLVGS